ncbi:MAG: hypothetical protein APF80_02995 [Alphaproteobacteria bacterium BRH_c36]|nr:MAG: hypothetical protein APF80_02995 [Alphaproteobacteria bacterium BRH_c36]
MTGRSVAALVEFSRFSRFRSGNGVAATCLGTAVTAVGTGPPSALLVAVSKLGAGRLPADVSTGGSILSAGLRMLPVTMLDVPGRAAGNGRRAGAGVSSLRTCCGSQAVLIADKEGNCTGSGGATCAAPTSTAAATIADGGPDGAERDDNACSTSSGDCASGWTTVLMAWRASTNVGQVAGLRTFAEIENNDA